MNVVCRFCIVVTSVGKGIWLENSFKKVALSKLIAQVAFGHTAANKRGFWFGDPWLIWRRAELCGEVIYVALRLQRRLFATCAIG